jgi:hypothetical protein
LNVVYHRPHVGIVHFLYRVQGFVVDAQVFFPDDVFHKRHHVTFGQLIEPDAHKFVFQGLVDFGYVITYEAKANIGVGCLQYVL